MAWQKRLEKKLFWFTIGYHIIRMGTSVKKWLDIFLKNTYLIALFADIIIQH